MLFNLSMLMDRLRIGGVELIREHDGELRLTRVAMVVHYLISLLIQGSTFS